MIATSLRGGLGNQMFEYAAGRALALRLGTELVLDLSFLESAQADVATTRSYALAPFALDARTTHGVRSWEPSPPGLGLRGRTASRVRRMRSDYTVLRQKGLDFQPAYFEARDRTHLVGFWQSERYFADHAETIRREFHVTRPLPAEIHDAIRVAPSVSVHVRRGDYANDPATNAHHGVLPVEWYRRALDEVATRTATELRVFVFSDDPEFCSSLDLGREVVVVDGAWPPEDDLRLMSECDHHVVANSSFSWWGAWLDSRPEAIVVAPRRWVADASVDTSHVVPERWIRI